MQAIIFPFFIMLFPVLLNILLRQNIIYKNRQIFLVVYVITYLSIFYLVLTNKFLLFSIVLVIFIWIFFIEKNYYEVENLRKEYSDRIDKLITENNILNKELEIIIKKYEIVNDQLKKLKELFKVVEEINENLSFEKIIKYFYDNLKKYFSDKITYFSVIITKKRDIVEIFEFPTPKDDIKEIYMKNDKSILEQNNMIVFKIHETDKKYEIIIGYNSLNSEHFIDELYFFLTETKIGFVRAILFRETEDLARHDSLTGLYLRRYFLKRLSDEYLRAVRYKTNLSLIMLDIDHFKQVNDKMGHLTGDYVLEKIADILKQVVGDRGLISRWGGEEFLVLLPFLSKNEVFALAEELRKNVEMSNFRYGKASFNITISCGISQYPTDSDDFKEIIEIADKKLYIAKSMGRNRVCG